MGLKRLKLSIINGLEKLETNTEFSGGNELRYGKRKTRMEFGVQYYNGSRIVFNDFVKCSELINVCGRYRTQQ